MKRIKRDDPRRLAARAAMDKASDYLRVLVSGFSSVMEQRCYNTEEIRDLLVLMNEVIPPAIATAEKAEKAYEPFRLYRRSRVSVLRRRKAS